MQKIKRLIEGIGFCLIAAAMVLNPFTIAQFLSPDKVLDKAITTLHVILFEIVLLIPGFLLYFKSSFFTKMVLESAKWAADALRRQMEKTRNAARREKRALSSTKKNIGTGLGEIKNRIKKIFTINKKNIVPKLLLLAFSILIALVILEIYARIYLFAPIALIPWYGNSVSNAGNAGILTASDNCLLRHELKPNLDTFFKLSKFRTNSQGKRDKEYNLTKGNNTFRVAVFGGSNTVPSGVNIEDAYHTLLEEYYNNESANMTYEFINLAQPGYTLTQTLENVKVNLPLYKPDFVLVELTALTYTMPRENQSDEVCNFKETKKKNPYLKVWLIPFIKQKLINIGILERENDDYYSRELDIPKFKQIIAEFNDISREENINITFLLLREAQGADWEGIKLAKEELNRYNLTFIDTAPGFKGKDREYYGIYKADSHYNAKAHHIFAEFIKEQLKI